MTQHLRDKLIQMRMAGGLKVGPADDLRLPSSEHPFHRGRVNRRAVHSRMRRFNHCVDSGFRDFG